MSNSKITPNWFNRALTVRVDGGYEPLDFLTLALELKGEPLNAMMVSYIRCLMSRIEDEHAFRCTPLTADEIKARNILKGYLKQSNSPCPECRGTGERWFHHPRRKPFTCNVCCGTGAITP